MSIQEQDKDLTGPENPDVQQDEQEIPDRAEEHGWTSHDTACAMQSEAAEDQIAGQEETQEVRPDTGSDAGKQHLHSYAEEFIQVFVVWAKYTVVAKQCQGKLLVMVCDSVDVLVLGQRNRHWLSI